MRQKRININGKEISYYESRDNGQTVVFVHGTSSCSSIFIRQLIDSVLSYQFRFIAVDLIGFGNSDASDKPAEEYSLKGLSNFLVEFTNALELKDVVFVGHNIGGNIILESTTMLDDLKGLVLLSSIPFSNPFKSEVFSKAEVLELISKAGIDSSEVHQVARLFVEENTKYPEFIPEIIRKADSKTREIFFKSVFNGDYKDQMEIISNLNIPVAIYCGEFDQMINCDIYKSLNIPTLWKGVSQTIRDVGHMFFYESPADFNISFEIFLNTVFKK